MDQDRDSLPSASAVQRLMQCQASHRMTLKARAMRQEAGESGGKGDEWRDKGTAMHDAIFKQSSADLETDQDRMDYSKIMKRFREFLGGWGAMNDDTVIREERLWLHHEITPIFSGRPDYIRISPNRKRAAIIDFKSLWNKAPEPRENDQLWSQAVLLAAEEPEVQEFTFQIISPHYVYQPHLANRMEVLDYEVKLRTMLSVAEREGNQPKTGDYCKHCGGLMICPAIQREAASKSEHPSELKLENAGKLLERLERMEKYIKEVREYYKLVLAKEPDSIPGWKIIEKQMRILKQPAKIRDAVVPVIGDKAFWDSVSVSITKIEAAWEKVKGTELMSKTPTQNVNVVLAPFITIRTQEASLVRDKKK
jgi:hypothetical protein